MLWVKAGPPVDYGLCDQVVTLYHAGFGTDGRGFDCARVVFACLLYTSDAADE